MSSQPDFSRRLPQLDGLRGVAIALVLTFHYLNFAVDYGAPRILSLLVRPTNLGWTGVDLFFVLSGFLIGGILLDARESRNYFRVFYRRRIYRIFPLYFAFLAVVFFAARLPLPSMEAMFTPAIPWTSLALFCQNFWMALQNKFGAVILAPTWSLAVEEQFYVTLPALIYFVKPRRLIWVLAGGILLAPLIRLAMFLAGPRYFAAISVLLPCRMDSLLFGVTAAYLLRRPGAWDFLRAHRGQLWMAVELLTGICLLFLFNPSAIAPATMLVGYDCFALFYTCILVLSLLDDHLAGVLQVKWLTGLGTIAYGVYLLHPLLFGLTFAVLGKYSNGGALSAIVGLVMTISLATLSWQWFEKPLVRHGHRESYAPAELPARSRMPDSDHRETLVSNELPCLPADAREV